MNIDELIARESIRNLVARYNSTLDSGRLDEAIELFAPDAVLRVKLKDGEVALQGADNILTFFSGAKGTIADRPRLSPAASASPAAAASTAASTAASMAGPGSPRYLRHYTATLQIDVVSATSAKSRCYFVVVMPHGVDHWGRYVDEFRLLDGTWRFASRRVQRDGYAEGGFVHAQIERGEAAS